jgi:hypothetical protein
LAAYVRSYPESRHTPVTTEPSGSQYDEMAKRTNVANRVQMHFLLMSPTPPKKIASAWPEWAQKGTEIPWIKLTLPPGVAILEVNRCNEAGERAAKSDYWRIVEKKAAHDG